MDCTEAEQSAEIDVSGGKLGRHHCPDTTEPTRGSDAHIPYLVSAWPGSVRDWTKDNPVVYAATRHA